MSQKEPVVVDTADRALRQFDNRMRILMNIPGDAWPEGERKEVNPHSWGLWTQGGEKRLIAFIRAPDLAQKALWGGLPA